MKLMMRKWKWLTGLLAAGLACATYLVAQVETNPNGNGNQFVEAGAGGMKPPDKKETADAAQLIDAINAGDTQTALGILHAYGVAEDTVLSMAAHLGKTPAPVELPEPFLKASVGGLVQMDELIKTNVQGVLPIATELGYERPIWMPRSLGSHTIASHDSELDQCPQPPIVVLNMRTNDPCFIRYFKWYDRYAEDLHSVILNGPNLSNGSVNGKHYDQANRILNALFQLIKARKPDAFVWLSVVKKDGHSDELWLKAMAFRPDGLQISNLRQFHSPFAETHARYVQIVGPDMPMMVSSFYGYEAALQQKGRMLTASRTNLNRSVGEAKEVELTTQLGSIGVTARQELAQVETNLQAMGYRGLSVHWLLLSALGSTGKAGPVDKSDLPDSRVGLLEGSLRTKDYARVFSLAANLITNSTPGDMNWTAAKLAEGMAWLSQTPPRTSEASAVLDEILTFNYKNRPGRDHYIITAARWRMYAAVLSGDTKKSQDLAQWVQTQPFRKDLKANFLKQYKDLLPPSINPPKSN